MGRTLAIALAVMIWSEIFFWHNISLHSFTLNLMMLPVIAIGAVAGVFIVRMFSEKAFRRFIQGVTVLSVIMMLV